MSLILDLHLVKPQGRVYDNSVPQAGRRSWVLSALCWWTEQQRNEPSVSGFQIRLFHFSNTVTIIWHFHPCPKSKPRNAWAWLTFHVPLVLSVFCVCSAPVGQSWAFEHTQRQMCRSTGQAPVKSQLWRHLWKKERSCSPPWASHGTEFMMAQTQSCQNILSVRMQL